MAVRIEHDTMGPVEVPAERLWGAQTERSFRNFRISDERVPQTLIRALALVKKVAAEVNMELGVLDRAIGTAVVRAADEIMAGEHDAEFPLVVWQTGSGTQTNMNLNEVIANRASEILGGPRGEGRRVHPNDHVNRGQSSNDVFPTAMCIAATEALVWRLAPALEGLADVLSERQRTVGHVVKIGRTHLQDATPLTLGQEIGGWTAQLGHSVSHVRAALPHLSELALGGTAVGTGLNTHPDFGRRAIERLSELTGLPFVAAPSKFEALAAHDGLVFAHGALKTVATALTKIANDVRWLASGPRAGIGEIRLPENEPGSSIMPGKINPTQCEALLMVCSRVLGNDVTMNVAGASGNFELNVQKPLLAYCFLESTRLLSDGCDSFRVHCAAGIEPNEARIRQHLESSLMLATALTPHIGYDRAAEIAKRAHAEGKTLRAAAIELGVSAQDFDEWVRPEKMT